MEGYMAEIRMFAGNFAPLYWSFCDGRLLPINNFNALFALIGNFYGGDGRTTFALPDLRGRVPVGTGAGPGLPSVELGEMAGTQEETLITSEMPAHNHQAQMTLPTYSGSVTPQAKTGLGSFVNNPAGNYPAPSGGSNIYSSSANAAMGSSPVTIISNNGSGSVTIGANGGSQPHNNMQPYLGMNYIICLEGIFPSRN